MANQLFSQSIPNLDSSIDMIFIEGGNFQMGSPKADKDALDREQPQHKVTLTSFYIGQFPVTQELWKAVMNNNPSHFQGDDRPVECVSWNNAQKFIQQLNELTENDRPKTLFYRLPTEAEWEYTARGGKDYLEDYKYAGSDRLKDVGWFLDNSDRETKPVGLKHPNQLGIYDMSGNVWEWCEDIWRTRYGSVNPVPENRRVNRGGSWEVFDRFCRCTRRNDRDQTERESYIGFRLLLAV